MREILTLENVQVDFRDLSKNELKKVFEVFENNDFITLDSIETYSKIKGCLTHISSNPLNEKGEGYLFGYYSSFEDKTEITYEKFMELFGNKEKSKEFNNLIEVLNEELTEEAYKETANKLNYELDFNFITQLAERMAQNKRKYEPYNWQKLDNIAELKQALYRHVMEVMKGNYEDDNRLFGHLESIALNAMFINYQLNKGSN